MNKSLSTLNVFFILFALCFSPTLQAQFRDIELRHERNEDKSVTISYTKKLPGSYTVYLDFETLENASHPNRPIVIKGYTGTLIKLKPLMPEQSIKLRYRYTYIMGNVDPKLDKNLVYALPYNPEIALEIRKLRHEENEDNSEDNSGNKTTFFFKSDEAQIIRSMRKGTVVKVFRGETDYSQGASMTPKRSYVLVEHDDGSLARYSGLHKDQIIVQEKQKVYPHSLIGVTDETAPGEFTGYFSVIYRHVEEKNGGKREYSFAYLDPEFKTENGPEKLKDRIVYTSTMDMELLQSEFTKREKKQYKKNPSKFQ